MFNDYIFRSDAYAAVDERIEEIIRQCRKANIPLSNAVVINVFGVKKFIEFIDAQDVVPIKNGMWLYDGEHGEYYCSECMHHKDTELPMYFPPYCNCCGASMTKVEGDD